jgi:hypothetical protein
MKGMTMNKLAMVIAMSLATAAPALAAPVPGTISFTGRLSTSAGPVTATSNITFHLYTAVTGGSSVWNETQSVTPSSAGLVYVELGSMTTFDQTDFDGSTRYLEITVGTETLSPRLPINSVPYAIRATDSDTVGGMPASSFVTSVTGSGAITHSGTNTVALTLTPCGGADQLYKWTGSAWSCVAIPVDTNTTYTATTNGLITVTGANTIGLSACGTIGHIAKYTASNTWQCAAETNNTYTAGAGIVINGSNVVGIDTATVPTLAANNTFTGANTFGNASNSFTGVGTNLTALNASNLASGTVPSARVSGTYSSAVAFTSASNAFTGTHTGDGSGLTALNAGNISTGVLAVARGGTGFGTTPANASMLMSGGSNNLVFTNAPAANNLLIPNGSNVPAWVANPTINVTGVNLASTRTRYTNVGVSEFQPGSNSIAYNGDYTYRYLPSGGFLVAHVSLPDGVTITALQCVLYDNDATYDTTVWLYRSLHTSPYSLSQLTSVSTSSNPGGNMTVSGAFSSVVDNSQYFYWLYFSPSSVCASNCRVNSCRLTYTQNSL